MEFSKRITEPNGDDRITVSGPQFDCDDKDGRTAVKIAALAGNESVVQEFMERRAFFESMNRPAIMLQLTTAMENQHDLMSVLPPDGPGRVERLRLVHGRTPLGCAAEVGETGVIRILLQYNEEIDERDELQGMTALHRAVEMGEQEAIKLLLRSDADREVADAKGRTALTVAVHEKQAAAMHLLLKYNPNVNIIDSTGLTPLLAAAAQGRVDMMGPLLEHGADVDARDAQGMTALFIAVIQGNVQMAELLLEHNAKVNVYRPGRLTALDFAADTALFGSSPDRRHIAKMLLENGADLHAKKGPEGVSTLGRAVCFSDMETKQLFLDHVQNGQSEHGIMRWPLLCFATFQRREDAVQLLIERGVSLQGTDGRYGRNALSWAVSRGNQAVFDLLLQTPRMAWDEADRIGRTPLFHAAVAGNEGFFKQLRLLGSDVHRPDRFGLTSLIVAVQHGHDDLVRQILSNHPLRQEPQDRFGRSLSWWIQATENTWIREILLEYDMQLGDAQMGGDESYHKSRPEKSSQQCDVCTLPLFRKDPGHVHGSDCEKYRICPVCHQFGAQGEEFTQDMSGYSEQMAKN